MDFVRKHAWKALAALPVAALVAFIVSFWGAPLVVFAAAFTKKTFFLTASVAMIVAGAVWAWLVFEHNDRLTYTRHGKSNEKSYVLPAVLAAGGAVATLVAAVLLGSWAQLRYQSDISETDAAVPQFSQRAPYQQAEALLSRNKGGVQGTSTRPMFLGDRWSIVIGGESTGIKSFGVVEWNGAGESPADFNRCEFGEGTPAVSGLLWNSLTREARFAHGVGAFDIDTGDIYGFCDETQAVMVVPLTRYVGMAPTKRVAAGVLVVRSGEDIEYRKNVDAGELPGPVYPESLVAAVERANAGRDGSLGDVFFVRENFLEPDLEAGENPNSRNAGQFMLVGDDGDLYAVTPLVLANSDGNQVVAVGVTNVSASRDGEVNPLVIHQLPQPRRANAEIANLVKAEFATLPWYSGLDIMEVIPVSDDQWVGYIGRDVSPEYRFTINAENVICVYASRGAQLVGCSDDANEPTGGTDGGAVEDLSVLTTEDLLRLRDELDVELDRRLLGVSPETS